VPLRYELSAKEPRDWTDAETERKTFNSHNLFTENSIFAKESYPYVNPYRRKHVKQPYCSHGNCGWNAANSTYTRRHTVFAVPNVSVIQRRPNLNVFHSSNASEDFLVMVTFLHKEGRG